MKTAIVIGGGLLGLEAAYGLLQQGLEVHVVHLMDHLMEVQLDADALFETRNRSVSLATVGNDIDILFIPAGSDI